MTRFKLVMGAAAAAFALSVLPVSAQRPEGGGGGGGGGERPGGGGGAQRWRQRRIGPVRWRRQQQ